MLWRARGCAAKPIRLMRRLLIRKQLYNLSDEAVVAQWRINPCFQVSCGEVTFQATELAKSQGIRRHRTYVKEVKSLRPACRHFRHFRHVRRRCKAVKSLRTIAGILMRELERMLPEASLPVLCKSFALHRCVLAQQTKDKIYSLHEPDIYRVGKGKDHKPWEYGRKASVVSTGDSQVIVGVGSHISPGGIGEQRVNSNDFVVHYVIMIVFIYNAITR